VEEVGMVAKPGSNPFTKSTTPPATSSEKKGLTVFPPVYEDYMSEYERGLMSLAIRHLDCLVGLRQKVTVDYFLYPPHKVIFTALNTLASDANISKIDLESLLVECKALGLESTGGSADYIILLTQGGSDKENFDFYLSKVKNSYLKYSLALSLIDSYKKTQNNSKDQDKALSGEVLLEEVNNELSNLQTFHGVQQEAVEFAKRAEEFVLERANNPQEVMGLRTGFETLDVGINGLMPGTLTIIAGQAKAGKSTVMLNMLDYIAIESDNPVPVLIISTEMHTDEDIAREIAMRSLIEERKIINGIAYNDPQLKPIIDKALAQIKRCKVYHIYMPEFNAAKICNTIYHFKLKHKIGLAVFDYIKMSTMSGNETEDRREDQTLGEIATALKNTAGKLNIPVLTGCQINTRTGRIADSDRLIRYANTVIEFKAKTLEELAQQDFYKHGTHWLNVFTTRGGGNVKIPIRFWKKCLKLSEAEPYETEGEIQDTNHAILTTPAEYAEIKNRAFIITRVGEAASQTDAHDLNIGSGDDDPNF
jgi:replicative DNA helicase